MTRRAALVLAPVALLIAVLAPRPADARDDPLQPTGSAVCNVAFTVAGVISFGGAFIPPESPVSANDVVVALTPILRLCGELYPATPPRQCFVSELIPNIGIPITPPDPVGILTDQIDALVLALGPLGTAITGPLSQFFTTALLCDGAGLLPEGEDPEDPSLPTDPDPVAEVPPAPEIPTEPDDGTDALGPAPSAPELTAPRLPAPAPAAAPVTAPAGPSSPSRPLDVVLASVPAPLRGPASVASLAALVALAALLQRQLSPRRRRSLLDAADQPGPD